MKWLCKIASVHDGLVGIDVKSHQQGIPCPYPAVVQGNAVQDRLCDEARSLPRPRNVLWLTGGLLAMLVIDSETAVQSAAEVVRCRLRKEAETEWRRRPVQGKLAHMRGAVFAPCLDLGAYTRCCIPPPWRPLLLPGDNPLAVDLSKVFFRSSRAVGGLLD